MVAKPVGLGFTGRLSNPSPKKGISSDLSFLTPTNLPIQQLSSRPRPEPTEAFDWRSDQNWVD